MNFFDFAPPQRDHPELLDAGRVSPSQIRRSLQDLRRVNRWLGGTRLVANETFSLLEKHELRRAVLLDIGTGSADIPLHLNRAARGRGVELQTFALDCKLLHLQVAREQLKCEHLARQDKTRILLLAGDAFALPLADNSVDIVISSLFLHHFRPPQIEKLLVEFSRVTRLGWVMSDLVRHYVPMIFFKWAWPIFARSAITRHDGAASFRRGYTITEMKNHLSRMQLPIERADVKAHFFRMSIVGEKHQPLATNHAV